MNDYRANQGSDFLHPEVFDAVWQQWTVHSAEAEEKAGKPLTEEISEAIWQIAVKSVRIRAGIATEQFKAEYHIGLYK